MTNIASRNNPQWPQMRRTSAAVINSFIEASRQGQKNISLKDIEQHIFHCRIKLNEHHCGYKPTNAGVVHNQIAALAALCIRLLEEGTPEFSYARGDTTQ